MKPSTELKYANLPLVFLAYGSNWHNRLNDAIIYGIVETALHSNYIDGISDHLPGDASADVYADVVLSMEEHPKGFDEEDDDHLRIVFAAERLGIALRDMRTTIAQHARLASFVESYEGRHGRDTRTKVYFKLLFQMRDRPNSSLSYDEFRVFCAVNSTIGGNLPVSKSSQEQIRMRSLGYKGRKAFEAEYSPDVARGDGATLLKNYQITRITDRLVRKGFFQKLSLGRATFYAQPHLSVEAFHEIIYARQTKRAVSEKQWREGADRLAEKIRETNQAAKAQREYRKAQPELPFKGEGQNGTPVFHRVDELRARNTPEELEAILRQPNARVFGTADGQVVSFSPLPGYKLQNLYAKHRKAGRVDDDSRAPEPQDDLPF